MEYEEKRFERRHLFREKLEAGTVVWKCQTRTICRLVNGIRSILVKSCREKGKENKNKIKERMTKEKKKRSSLLLVNKLVGDREKNVNNWRKMAK